MNLEIINIAANTKNNKDIKNHTHFIKLKNSICGDEIQIKLIIKGEKITNIGYQTDSCIYCQASASLLSKISMNSKKDKIIKLCNEAKLFFDNYDSDLFADTTSLVENLAEYFAEMLVGSIILFPLIVLIFYLPIRFIVQAWQINKRLRMEKKSEKNAFRN